MRRRDVARAVATGGSVVGAIALVLQFRLDLTRNDLLNAAWQFIGYFTIIGNFFVTAILASAALRPGRRSGFNGARTEAAGASAITFIAIVYYVVLAAQWSPQGLQLVVDVLLHAVMPAIYMAYWLARARGLLMWRDTLYCAILPLGYAFYALLRGALDGWYPYDFLNAGELGALSLLRNIVFFSIGFFALALALIALDRAIGRSFNARAVSR